MPRGSDHRKDDCDLYRQFDTEDLTRIVGWMREVELRTFVPNQVRAVSVVATGGYRWGEKRIRRVLRFGVSIGWLSEPTRGRFEITSSAIATLPPFDYVTNTVAAQLGTNTAAAKRMWRNAVLQALKECRT